MADLTRLPATASLDEVIAVIERDGGVIVEDFVTPGVLADLKSDLVTGIEACSRGRDDFSGGPGKLDGGNFHGSHTQP